MTTNNDAQLNCRYPIPVACLGGMFSVLSARPNRNRLTTHTALMSAEMLRCTKITVFFDTICWHSLNVVVLCVLCPNCFGIEQSGVVDAKDGRFGGSKNWKEGQFSDGCGGCQDVEVGSFF